MIVAYPLQLNKYQDLWVPKMCRFLNFLKNCSLEECLTVQKYFNDYVSYVSIGTQLKACSLKISSHSHHICRSKGVNIPKMDKYVTKTGYTNILRPRIPRDIFKSRFFSNH